ncbi:MAG: hypothetical protein IJ814_03150 [Paludibacteraceae bacterium]|nr:hypothetical protein [Paludibacteraceae bacterium]
MKKIYTLIVALATTLTLSAQLAWDTEMSKDDFNNAKTVYSKTENVSWSSVPLIGDGISLGKLVIDIPFIGSTPYEDECVIALPEIGIAEKVYFSWHGGSSSGTLTIFESADHSNWSQVFSTTGNASVTAKADSASLKTTTRYLKFYATGKVAATFRKIKVSELKSLSVGIEEWEPASAMVDDAPATKNVNVSWTNIVASVTSTNPQFSASVETVGQKNLIDQKTTITLYYSHAEAGTHEGEIVISGEGREARIRVAGTTKKYDQTLTWNQTLGECIATDELSFNASASSGLDVVYLSSDTTIAKAEGNALQIRRSGTVTLTATQPGNYKFNAANQIEKTLVIHKADPNVSASAEELTYGQRLSEVVLHESNGEVPGDFTWLDISTDTILDAGDYILSLLFTPADTGIYNLRTLPVALRVNKAVQTIVWEDQDSLLTVGVTAISTAELSSGLPITYAYTACLLSIEDGVITPENEGEVTVIAYHPGNHNYLPTTVVMQAFTIQANPNETATGVEQLTPEQLRTAKKYIHAGKVYVSFGGRVYDAKGELVK